MATAVRGQLEQYLRQLFALKPETDYAATLSQVKAGVDFKGGNLWSLIFAILIASVGLNVNSTAVVIGAMLISPLMGPIIGAGLALGINDIELFRRATRNLAVAAGVSILTSTLYFALSPLAAVQSELLARTRPTLYDVLIATFGGAAGMVALTRKGDKGNVLPGVAIATALMPPLCTIGFGLAQGNWHFVIGALHLFIINALFICLATLGLTRLLHFERIAYLDPLRARRIRLSIALITLATAVPSAIVALNVISETRFESAARRFAADNLRFSDRSVVNLELSYGPKVSTIVATIIGPPLAPETLKFIENRLPDYKLARTRLVLRQSTSEQLPAEQLSRMVRQGIIEDLYRRNESTMAERNQRIRTLEAELAQIRQDAYPIKDIVREAAGIYPRLAYLSIGRSEPAPATGSTSRLTVTATWSKLPNATEQARLKAYLQARLKTADLQLVNARLK